MDSCAYCGGEATTRDHVVPSALYPGSKAESRVQRITVAACRPCNGGWSDDETHFRNVLLMAGAPSPVALEVWRGPVLRSLDRADGGRRARDLLAQMVPIPETEAVPGHTHKIYPYRDERVMRIVRKAVRALCHHHGLPSPVSDGAVRADHHRYQIPPEILADMTSGHIEEDIFDYKYAVIGDDELHSFWALRFYQRVRFFCVVFQSVEARKQAEAGAH